jgi:flavin reductase (DIM6/NTAB) family NADH-FMN oxidoreductase RutF
VRMSRTVFTPGDEGVNPYALLTSLVVPRPIAWVSTLSAEGKGNLAPHSFFTVASNRPPTVLFSSLGRKDTVKNVEATREFVISFASEALMNQVNDSSAPFEHGDDESIALSIDMEPSESVAPLRVAGSPASIECRLSQVVQVGSSYVVMGEVTAITVVDEVLVDGQPAIDLLRPVSRLGGQQWGRPVEPFDLVRPSSVEDVL